VKLEETLKLSREYDAWERGRDTAAWSQGLTGAQFVAEVERRRIINQRMRSHAYVNFGAVVEALEKTIAIAIEAGWCEDNFPVIEVRGVLAKAKEVKT